MLVTARWFCRGRWHTLAKTSVMFKVFEWKTGGEKCQFLPNLPPITKTDPSVTAERIAPATPHFDCTCKKKRGKFSKVVRNTDTKSQITQQSVRHVALQNPAWPPVYTEVDTFMPLILQPDLAASILMPQPKPTTPARIFFFFFRNTKLRASVGSTDPMQLSPLCPKKTGLLTSALLGGFSDFTSGGHSPAPQHREEIPPCRAALLHLSWRGHQTCTPQDVNMQAQSEGWELL